MRGAFLKLILCSILALSAVAQQAEQPASQLNGTFQISGAVVDAVTGQALSRARVGISPSATRDALTTLTTGQDGQFIFPNLVPGKYTLTAYHRGYLTQSFNQHEGFSSSIAVGPDLESTNLVFRLAPESSITGTISDEAGEPVRSAQVLLFQIGTLGGRQGPRMRRRDNTDEEGTYHFRHLQAGEYLIAVSANAWYAQRPWPKQRVTGTVYSDNPGGFVYSLHPGGSSSNPASSTYVEEPDNSPLDVAYPVTFFPGVTEPDAAAPIVLKSGDKAVADVSLQPVPALHIRFPVEKGENGAPRTNFGQLQSRVFDTSVMAHAETRYLGADAVELVGVAPGHYQMESANQGESKNRTFSYTQMDLASSGDFPMDQKNLSVAVSATIQFEPGASGERGTLQLLNSKSQESFNEQYSGAGDIEFHRHVLPGVYELSISGGNGEFLKALSATGATVNGRTLEIKGGAPVKLKLTLARGQGQVKGVALREGKPFAGAMIVLAPADSGHNQVLFRRDQSDSDGTFTLASVVPGRYTLLALENGWNLEWMNPAVLKPYLAGGEVIQVEQNGKYEVKVKVQ